jgi:hypothetical protein
MTSQFRRRKISQVEGQYDRCPGLDRCRKDMAIIRVWQRQIRDMVLIVTNISRRQHPVHDVAGADQSFPGNLAVRDKIIDPLVVDLIRPAWRDILVDTKLDKQIPCVKRVKQVGIIDDDRAGGARAP